MAPQLFGGLVVKWSEPIQVATLSANALTLTWAGLNRIQGDGDDIVVTGGLFEFHPASRVSTLKFNSLLPAGLCRAVVDPSVKDLAGNTASEFVWTFEIFTSDLSKSRDFQVIGDIDVPSALDTFAFSAAAGQLLFLDEQGGDCLSPIHWRLLAPDGVMLFNETLGAPNCGVDVGHVTIPAGGVYTLFVDADPGRTNAYQFQVWNVPPANEFHTKHWPSGN